MSDRDQELGGQPLWYEQESFKEFRTAYSSKERQTILFFVGSGLSQSANFPTWQGLLEEMRGRAQKFGIVVGGEFDKLLAENNFPEAGSLLHSAFEKQKPHPGRWRSMLNEIFNDHEKHKNIPPVFQTFCRLKWSKVITTNYDRLLELAYRREHINRKLKVVHPFVEGYDDSRSHSDRLLFKIHGDIGDPNSQIVLTTREYKELYDNEHFLEVLKHHLNSAKLTLFLGFSHDDPYFRRLFSTVYRSKHRPQNSFALFAAPASGGVSAFADKLKALNLDTGIKSITYANTENKHEEFNLFLEYLHRPEPFDKRFGASNTRKKATVILLYTGGTIGSIRHPGEHFKDDELQLPQIGSRFHPRLEKISRLLQKRFRQFYNTATEFQFELKWEILPENEQILSENATVQHWNNLVKKIKDVIVKYVHGPRFITPEMQLPVGDGEEEGWLRLIHEREVEEYQEVYGKDKDLSPNQFMGDLKDRYIAGMVILHGTDTLASTASALSVGLRNLPFPIILTGANRPPDEEALYEREVYGGKSDTWKNLVTSLYFLQCFGHRFTELFVAFGDTIHHGMNLRKTTIETTPLKRANGPTHDYDIEPFIFRNYSITKQYLFRLIDGVFCNNFYPVGKLSYTALIRPEYTDLRHVRRNPFPAELPAELPDAFENYGFSPAVKCVTVSPSFPPIDVGCMLSREPGTRAILVEGYKSGTYPTIANCAFTDFMYDLHERDIPIILVGHYGITTSQERYQTFPIKGKDIPVLRLYGMIPETALPLLCRVVGCIEEKDWDCPELADGSKVNHRIGLITTALKKLFKDNNNIISIEFGDITDQKARAERIIENTRSRNGEGQAFGREHFFAQALARNIPDEHDLEKKRLRHERRRRLMDYYDIPEDTMLRIPRVDLLWAFGEIIKSYESVGAAPDGFAILSNMGFEWGFEGFHALQRKRAPRMEGSAFFECEPATQKALVSSANRLLRRTIKSFERSGLVFFVEKQNSVIKVEPEPGSAGQTSSPRFSFPVFIKRAHEHLRDDEKYNVQSYSRDEAEFFRELNSEPDEDDEGGEGGRAGADHEFDEDARKPLAIRYDKLMEASWKNKTGSLDWFILGVFKGVACAVAWYFLFDRWAKDFDTNKQTGVDKALQQSVQCDIERGSEDFFKFRMTYYGWYERI